eukprot:TRINITY_DN13905_c0_g1_i1.p1 TRINITY_DN13905_c0_g1~~TRINITY_DN13905_c0_g1_i1.p1  ORF type:complete len:541 (+),score=155.59 TRINITY_DN13905_c0_g1_i1:11-1633(+)
MLRSMFSVGGLATLACFGYLVMMVLNMSKVIYPLWYVNENEMIGAMGPAWKGGVGLNLQVVVGRGVGCACEGCHVVWEQEVRMGEEMEISKTVWLDESYGSLWHDVQNHNSPHQTYVNYCLMNPVTKDTQHTHAKLTAHTTVPKYTTLRWLLQDVGYGHLSGVEPWADPTAPPPSPQTEAKLWKSDIAARIVSSGELIPPPEKIVIRSLHPFLKVGKGGRKKGYLPPFYSSAQNLNAEGYKMINGTALPLNLQLVSTELSRWLLLNHFDATKQMAKSMGIADDMLDEMLDGFAATSVPLLTVTMVATLLHCLFEFLAFKSDISFWENNSSLKGLSVRALFVDLIFQLIIVLYLMDENASFVILIPSVVSVVIQLWKIRKATGVAFTIKAPYVTFKRLEQEASCKDEVTKVTMETDKLVNSYIVRGLLPIVIAYSTYVLITSKHQSWWSWLIGTLAGITYSAGFLLMTPQVIINYKLKSVSHLPWNVLTYKFINTFIDDLFAMIVRLPSMHRLSVFRDDIIFIICIIQRFYYRVDKDRKEE